jgi:hypothetical protein
MMLRATADVRSSFVAQFLMGARIHAQRALEIERAEGAAASDPAKVEHRACVVSAILQSAASLEAEINETIAHGPGSHLGSNRMDTAARDFLRPLADDLDRGATLRRFEIVLHLLGRPEMSRDEQSWRNAHLLVQLRNALVHFRSIWGRDMENASLFRSLRQLNHQRPPFVAESNNFFPHHFLSGTSARWAVESAITFVDAFYSRLNVASRLDGSRDRLTFQ